MGTVQILGKPWDTITGCTKISAGCKNCYAESFTEWINGLKQTDKYQAGFHQVVCHADWLDRVLAKRARKTYFVNSMADTFHKDVPEEFIQQIFTVMNAKTHLNFQVLTKRSERMLEMAPRLDWRGNIWAGVSVENAKLKERIEHLRAIPARRRWIMFEPLVGPVGQMNLEGIEWAIVGGESGTNWREMNVEWVREIRDQCIDQGVKFVFKQYAAKKPEKLGRMLDGVLWDQRPEPLTVDAPVG